MNNYNNIFVNINVNVNIISVSATPTVLQAPVAKLCHLKNNQIIELPEDFSVIKIGKTSKGGIPDLDLSSFPFSELVSRNHAQIRFDGNNYFIKDTASTNGTYINKYPMLSGIWYKIAPRVQISFDKQNIVSFVFAIS